VIESSKNEIEKRGGRDFLFSLRSLPEKRRETQDMLGNQEKVEGGPWKGV